MHWAHRLRDKIEGVLNTDRTVRLVVQLEAALNDSRFEVSHPHIAICQGLAVSIRDCLIFLLCAHGNTELPITSGLPLCAGGSTPQR